MYELFLAVFKETKKGLKGYIKAQLIMMLITFIILLIGLKLIGIEYSVLKAAGIAIVDAVPVIGSGIIMIPWAIYKFVKGAKLIAFQIALLYAVLTVLKQIIQPKVVGDSIGLRPLYTFLAAIVGTAVIGPLGVMIGPLIAVAASNFVKYKNLMIEEDTRKKLNLKRENEFSDVKYEVKSKDTK